MNILYNPVKFVKETSYSNDFNTKSFVENPKNKNLNGNEIKEFYETLISEKEDNPTSSVANTVRTRKIRRKITNDSFCRHSCSTKFKNSDLFKAATNGSLTEAQKCLTNGAIDINCVDEFLWTPLMCAAFAGAFDFVEFALRNGAKTELKNLKRQTARDLAVKNGFAEIARLIDRYSNKIDVEESEYELKKSELNATLKWICDKCGCEFSNNDPASHLSSTVHLLNANHGPSSSDKPYFLINRSNAGYQLLVKEGWDERSGLGIGNTGRKYPIKTLLKQDRLGLGVKPLDRPRVTHFEPFDISSIKQQRSCKQRSDANDCLKIRLKRKSAKSKELETNFRREFYLNG